MNSRYKADPTAVNNFLFAFSHLKVNGMMKATDAENPDGRNVRIYKGRRAERLRFYPSSGSPLMHHYGSSRQYRVGVSGFPDADLSEIISDQPDYWKDKVMISLLTR